MTATTVRQIAYGIAAVAGVVLTWFFNLRFDGPGSYLSGWFANDAASSAAVDLLILAAACSVFMVAESRRLGWRSIIPVGFVVAGCLVAMACAVPLFLLVRERYLHRERVDSVS